MTDTFNYPYKNAYVNSIQYKTIVDETFTGNEQRRDSWTNPRMSWALEFEKNPTNTAAVATFFKTQKGRKTAFHWTWDSSKGGDGHQYLVRFDSDTLDFNIIEAGYSTFKIKLVEVHD